MPEREAKFRCWHPTADAIGWRVNNLPSRDFPDSTLGSINDKGTMVNTLTIPARSEYNETEVVCLATFINGSPAEVTPSVKLIIVKGWLEFQGSS